MLFGRTLVSNKLGIKLSAVGACSSKGILNTPFNRKMDVFRLTEPAIEERKADFSRGIPNAVIATHNKNCRMLIQKHAEFEHMHLRV